MFQVPSEAPSSVQEKNGKVLYRIRTVIYRPAKINLEFLSDFVVIRPNDLNLDPKLQNSSQQEDVKNYRSWCCMSESITLIASIPQIGFVVGQKIPIKVSINNPSNVKIVHVEFSLEKRIRYTSYTPINKNHFGEFEIQRIHYGSPFSRCKKEYRGELKVPPTVPSTNSSPTQPQIIDIYYILVVRATVSFLRLLGSKC